MLHRIDPDTWDVVPNKQVIELPSDDETRRYLAELASQRLHRADAPTTAVELPGMWEEADLSGGEADSAELAVVPVTIYDATIEWARDTFLDPTWTVRS